MRFEKYDAVGFCDGCRTPGPLFRYKDFHVCRDCLPKQSQQVVVRREVTERTLALRKKRADISRQRKMLDRNRLKAIGESSG